MAYDNKIAGVPINQYSKIPKDKKLSSGKEIKSIFPLQLSTIKPP